MVVTAILQLAHLIDGGKGEPRGESRLVGRGKQGRGSLAVAALEFAQGEIRFGVLVPEENHRRGSYGLGVCHLLEQGGERPGMIVRREV